MKSLQLNLKENLIGKIPPLGEQICVNYVSFNYYTDAMRVSLKFKAPICDAGNLFYPSNCISFYKCKSYRLWIICIYFISIFRLFSPFVQK